MIDLDPSEPAVAPPVDGSAVSQRFTRAFALGLAAGVAVAAALVGIFALGRATAGSDGPQAVAPPNPTVVTAVTTSPTLKPAPAAAVPTGTRDQQLGIDLPLDRAAFPALPTAVPTIWVAAGTVGGDGSQAKPFATVQAAANLAKAGDVVHVAAGDYREAVKSVRSGEAGKPIRLIGENARLVAPTVDSRVVEIDHDFITLEGFTLSGGDKLIWVQQAKGVRIVGNNLSSAGGECIRIKYLSTGNEIANNTIKRCGEINFDLSDDHKNGEGIYVGTAPEQRAEKNPTDVVDATSFNWIHDNAIDTRAECVDLKEGASGNLVESNTCTGQLDPEGSAYDSRGNGNFFVSNVATDVVGAGVRLGGDEKTDGGDNVVVKNRLLRTGGYGVKLINEKQRLICGNEFGDNRDGTIKGGDDAPYKPAAACR